MQRQARPPHLRRDAEPAPPTGTVTRRVNYVFSGVHLGDYSIRGDGRPGAPRPRHHRSRPRPAGEPTITLVVVALATFAIIVAALVAMIRNRRAGPDGDRRSRRPAGPSRRLRMVPAGTKRRTTTSRPAPPQGSDAHPQPRPQTLRPLQNRQDRACSARMRACTWCSAPTRLARVRRSLPSQTCSSALSRAPATPSSTRCRRCGSPPRSAAGDGRPPRLPPPQGQPQHPGRLRRRALPENALAPFLGGLTREVFGRAFGLDAKGLREGGRDAGPPEGELGASLFAAASGLRG